MHDLILKIEGKVLSSNFDAFQESALAIVDSINTELVTDTDFIEAEDTIKLCKLTEDRLYNAKQQAVNQTVDIAELFKTIDQLSSKIRETRLNLEKSVKTEKLKRKNDVISDGVESITQVVKGSVVEFAFSTDIKAIHDAVKGKRSLEKMTEAVDEVVESEVERLDALITLFNHNRVLVEEAVEKHTGLFPDWKTICLTATETVEQTIEARINKFKLDEQEKIKREEEQAYREAERLNRHAEETERLNEEAIIEQHKSEDIQPEVKTVVERVLMVENYILTVNIHGSRDEALVVSENVDGALIGFDCVTSVNLNKSQIAA